MKRIARFFMGPIARRKLDALYEERRRLEASILRARRAKGRVSDLYALAKKVNHECCRWERWT
jgi:hypothetical protein